MCIALIGKTCSGKTTIANEMLKYGYHRLVTTTSRPRRNKEIDGKDYDFVSKERFEELIKQNYFAEWKVYHTAQGDWYYGTPVHKLKESDNATIVILTPDGYKDIVNKLDNITVVYIYANNQTIRNRLKKRGDNKEEAERRITQDGKDFKDATLLADKIFYNNDGTNLKDIVHEVISYASWYEENKI